MNIPNLARIGDLASSEDDSLSKICLPSRLRLEQEEIVDEWRLLDLEYSSFAAATPLISTLLKLKSEGQIPNTLALLTFKKPAVCLFYYNDPEKDIDMESCQKNDIEFARRGTGGSPYWADPGTLLIYFYLDRKQVPGFPRRSRRSIGS